MLLSSIWHNPIQQLQQVIYINPSIESESQLQLSPSAGCCCLELRVEPD